MHAAFIIYQLRRLSTGINMDNILLNTKS